jgi:hypothetical protein
VAKNPAAVSLGRKGGKKSAAGRMAKMTPEERSEVARIAAAASAKVRSAKAAKKSKGKLTS